MLSWLYNLNNFLLLLHSSSFALICFAYSLGTYFKVKCSFWYFDLITSPSFVVNIIVIISYFLCVLKYGTTFSSFSNHLCH